MAVKIMGSNADANTKSLKMERPNLDKDISLFDFNDFYWLKTELVAFCKTLGIGSSGSKIELTKKIRHYLTTGQIPPESKKVKPAVSNFNWNTELLTNSTIITDNYRNTQNVRAFFIDQIGSHFKFNVSFMNWMTANEGKTLGDAANAWKRLKELEKDKSYVKAIAPQFEYNKYIRAFLLDNPNLSIKDAMKYWKLKREKRGANQYDPADLKLK